MAPSHIFQDPDFWTHFMNAVQSKSWKCNLSAELLFQNLEKDAALYKDDNILRKRRQGALPWIKNETLWVTVLLGACKELAYDNDGIYSKQLQNLHMLEALADFVEHINCFYVVASIMASKGVVVKPLSQDSSLLHDIDKLDPIMLVGYSERFEDNAVTSIWDVCVDRHTQVNPHHQAHNMWDESYMWNRGVISCPFSDSIRMKALREMVCDKVSRRLQKNLNGKISKEMWDVEESYFKGLPKDWLIKSSDMMKRMKASPANSK